MRKIPILFSTPMVKSIIAEIKTETRRIIKLQPDNELYFLPRLEENGILEWDYNQIKNPKIKCPYGIPGNILWVRETWCRPYNPGPFLYKADQIDMVDSNRWRPSIHMPYEACRLHLEHTNTHVERLQDITEKACIAEGIEQWPDGNYVAYGKHKGKFSNPKDSYRSLWEYINGPGSWDLNPWVWAIKFKKIANENKI